MPTQSHLFSTRLQLVTGKGGVGKTTVAAALALASARRGLRSLVVEFGERASMQDVLDCGPVGPAPAPVGRGVWAMTLQFGQMLREYVTEHVPFARLAEKLLGHAGLDRFLRAAPGVTEALALDTLGRLALGRRGEPPRFDRVFVDLDATGHALMLLEVPRVLQELLGEGPLRRTLARTSFVLSDRELARLHLVTIPEELAVQETLELYHRLRETASAQLGALIVNQVPGESIPSDLTAALEQVVRARASLPESLAQDVRLAQASLDAAAEAQAHTLRLATRTSLPVLELPRLSSLRPSVEELLGFGEKALESGSEPEVPLS
jgi:arsenite/tail-anchored protein-transporting ATPase